MKRNFYFYFFVLAAATFLVSCHFGKTSFTNHDTGKTVHVSTDDLFNIALDSNPTTGYSWEILPYDESIVKVIKSNYSPNSDRMGSNGKRIIEFKAFGKGRTSLELLYLRVWEKHKLPIKKFKITVIVE